MKLRKSPKRKAEQALDALAGATKIWSDVQIGKRAGKGVEKARRVRLPSFLRGKPAKAIGAAAVAGGAGAVVARKLKSDGPQEYTGPPPSVASEAAASAPDAPAPPAVAPEPDPSRGVPAAGVAALRDDEAKDSETPAEDAAPAASSGDAASEKA